MWSGVRVFEIVYPCSQASLKGTFPLSREPQNVQIASRPSHTRSDRVNASSHTSDQFEGLFGVLGLVSRPTSVRGSTPRLSRPLHRRISLASPASSRAPRSVGTAEPSPETMGAVTSRGSDVRPSQPTSFAFPISVLKVTP